MKQLTVIIPLYNRENYINRTLRSVFNQSLDKNLYDVIIVDDNSTDKSLSAISSYMDDIILIQNKKNYGLPKSLNIGIKNTKTRYFVRIDSDDFVNEHFLLILLQAILNNENFKAVACDYFLVDENEAIMKRISSKINPIGCGIIFERDAFIDLGLYNETFVVNEEVELMNRFIKKYKLLNIPFPLYRYRMHKNNLTKNTKLKKKYDLMLKEINYEL